MQDDQNLRLPVGVSNFKELVTENYCLILMIYKRVLYANS